LGTHLQVRCVDGFSCMMAQTTRNCASMCVFWVSLTLRPHLGVKAPQTPNFGGVNRRLQAKHSKSKNMHIIKTTPPIPNELYSDEDHQMPFFVGGPNTHVKNPRWRTADILEKSIKSPYLGCSLNHFDQTRRSDAVRSP